jgi:GNAT superfamily N-acetyltransferase
MMPVKYHLIPFSSLFYTDLAQLRQDVLRTPLGQTLEFDQTRTDHTDWHLGACTASHLVGGISLTPQNTKWSRMRQMAVAPAYQSFGIGKGLISAAEELAKSLGYRVLILDAREGALAFYKGLGYAITSKPFIKANIPHREMQKRLDQANHLQPLAGVPFQPGQSALSAGKYQTGARQLTT